MGGAVCTTLALQRPDMIDGMILEAPMLYVSDDLKPPWIIVQLFRHVIIKIPGLKTWPVAPSKDILDRCFTDPALVAAARKSNPICYESKPRLASAYALAFQATEWMESRLKDVSVPFLILHGDADVVTDPEVSKTLYINACATSKTLKMVPGGKHADTFWRMDSYDAVQNWLQTQLD